MLLRLRKCLLIIPLYAVSVAYNQMFVMVPIVSKFSKYFWCRDIRVCTCGKNRYETGDFDKKSGKISI